MPLTLLSNVNANFTKVCKFLAKLSVTVYEFFIKLEYGNRQIYHHRRIFTILYLYISTSEKVVVPHGTKFPAENINFTTSSEQIVMIFRQKRPTPYCFLPQVSVLVFLEKIEKSYCRAANIPFIALPA
jgi:hypothetical protein